MWVYSHKITGFVWIFCDSILVVTVFLFSYVALICRRTAPSTLGPDVSGFSDVQIIH